MECYYLNMNQQPSGQYELHKEDCTFLDIAKNKQYIGYFSNCKDAIQSAKIQNINIADKIDGCFFSCKECNHG